MSVESSEVLTLQIRLVNVEMGNVWICGPRANPIVVVLSVEVT